MDLLVESLDRFHGGGTLRSHGQAQDATMIEGTSDAATDRIRQPFCGTNALYQARRKPTAESLIEDSNRIVIGIVTPDAETHHVDRALVDVFLLDQVVTRFCGMGFDLFLLRRRPLGPRGERLTKFGLHCGRVKIADYSQNDVVGMDIGPVPVEQILPRYGCYGLVLGDSCIRVLLPISELRRLAACDLTDLIVAA